MGNEIFLKMMEEERNGVFLKQVMIQAPCAHQESPRWKLAVYVEQGCGEERKEKRNEDL